MPLGLVERKHQQRRKEQEDPNREQVFQLEETVITQKYQHETFLQEIIGGTGQENQHIAITGEPGAGKTTLLYKIATWIEEHQKGLPILISLAALEQQSLEDYLLNNWLKKIEEFILEEHRQDKTALQKALKKRFREGRIWLLLDGLDEMAANSSGSVLITIRQYLDGWINKARIVLTSRSNVWDEQKTNPLSDFKTFRTLQFTDEQVTEFIKSWFKNDLSLNPSPTRREDLDNIVSQLQNQLKEPQYQSIQELIHNPLRLAMLCEVWYNNPGQLPDTKAQLYERYVRDYYQEWKPEQHQINKEKQHQLNRKLGELALQQLDSEVRFRIGETVAYEVMGCELFKLACRVGWLNIVDREAGTDEPVYAFYHPSFQEYFAATVIDDWDYFLPRKHKNKPVKGKKYRIFEAKWKEPFLLWLGRRDVKKIEKEAFIEKLITFEDGCGKYYYYKAYCLAAIGLREFKDCSRKDKIVKQIVNWGFSNFRSEIEQIARATLVETERETVIPHLIKIIPTPKILRNFIKATVPRIFREVAESLGKIGQGNKRVIAALVELIQTSENQNICFSAAKSLGQIDPGNQVAISYWAKTIQTTDNRVIFDIAIENLEKIGQGNSEAISALIKIIRTSRHDKFRWLALDSLPKIVQGNQQLIVFWLKLLVLWGTEDEFACSYAIEFLEKEKTGQGNPEAISNLVKIIQTTEDKDIFCGGVWTLEKIGQSNPEAIAALLELIRTSHDEETCRQAVETLRNIDPGNQLTIAALLELIQTSHDEKIRSQAAESLGNIDPGNQVAISTLRTIILRSHDEEIRLTAADSLGKIHLRSHIAIAALVSLIKNSKNEWTRCKAAERLGYINPGNEVAIAAFIEIFQTSDKEWTCDCAAKNLEKIGQGNQQAISALIEIIRTSKYKGRPDGRFLETQDEWVYFKAIKTLGKIGQGNQQAMAVLEELIQTTYDDLIRTAAIETLGNTDPGNQVAVTALLKLIQTSKSDWKRSELINILGKIGQGNSEASATLVELIKATRYSFTNPTRHEAEESLTQVLTKSEMARTLINLGYKKLTWKIWNYLTYVTPLSINWHCAQTLPYPEFYQAWHKSDNYWRQPRILGIIQGIILGIIINISLDLAAFIINHLSDTFPQSAPFYQPEINSK